MKQRGFSLIELLVGAALTAVIMTVALMFFQSSRRTSEQTNTWNDVQVQLQAITQLLAQDLQQAGSSLYVYESGGKKLWTDVAAFGSCGSTCVLTVTPGGSTGGLAEQYDGLAVRYVTSLRAQAQACRNVSYSFEAAQTGEVGMRLLRTDAACGNTGTPTALAGNILAFDVAYQCGGGTVAYANPSSCTTLTPPSYARTATYTIIIASENELQGTAARKFTTVSGSTIDCPDQRYCYSVAQQSLLPNLKDR